MKRHCAAVAIEVRRQTARLQAFAAVRRIGADHSLAEMADGASSSDDAGSSQLPTLRPTDEEPEAIAAMLAKLASYVQGEAEISVEDYRLLQAMNLAAAERYSHMADYSTGLVEMAARLQNRCEAMMPQLAQVLFLQSLSCRGRRVPNSDHSFASQVDVLEAQVGELESAVEQLDSYSKRLEAKFVALQGP